MTEVKQNSMKISYNLIKIKEIFFLIILYTQIINYLIKKQKNQMEKENENKWWKNKKKELFN